jgi:hypothetical protein
MKPFRILFALDALAFLVLSTHQDHFLACPDLTKRPKSIDFHLQPTITSPIDVIDTPPA